MSKSREAFEEFLKDMPPGIHRSTSRDVLGEYASEAVELAWLAWQASRKQALEEAAAVCDANRDDAREAKMLALWHRAQEDKESEFCQTQIGQSWSSVRLFNAGLRTAADAIRSLEGNATKETT